MTRYARIYNFMKDRRDVPRHVFAAGRMKGRDYMTAEMRREFDLLPTPSAVQQAARSTPTSSRSGGLLGALFGLPFRVVGM
jgi:3-methyladenine DNA glycosylase/8-oxoguanine DNA glycosylase